MINHVRTLLLNSSPASRPSATFYLEELVDPEFRKLELPAYLKAVRDGLFPTAADKAFINFRLHQYMRILHSAEYEAEVLAYDPRVTYLYDHPALILNRQQTVTATGPSAVPEALHLAGSASTEDVPVMDHRWKIRVLDSMTAEVENVFQRRTTTQTLDFSGGLTKAITLTGLASLFVKLSETYIVAGNEWTLNVRLPPPEDLPSVITSLEPIVEVHGARLFGSPATGQAAVYRDLWEKHNYLTYRLTGVLLAYAMRAEEVRVG